MKLLSATLSVDLDNRWAYTRAAGHDDWESSPSYFGLATERILRTFQEFKLPLTVFLVGRDLQFKEDREAILRFNELSSWEPANHSFNHLPWMHTMSEEEVKTEIYRTHDAIEELTGRRPVGFRGPGFSCPPNVIKHLIDLNYQYDSSVFPTSIAPLSRWIFLMRSKLRGPERERAKKLYGGFSSLLQPNRPFSRSIDEDQIWEIPVTTMPFLRTPIHLSYFLFLASISLPIAKTYFRTALNFCRWSGTSPSLLLHPPDFMGKGDDHGVHHLPGMHIDHQLRIQWTEWAIKTLAEKFTVQRMCDFAGNLNESKELQTASSMS